MTRITEDYIQKKFADHAASLGYKVHREYKLASGILDVLLHKPARPGSKFPDKYIAIEIKARKAAKHALGQILAYRSDLYNKLGVVPQCKILVFNYESKHYGKKVAPSIKKTCAVQGIPIRYAYEIWNKEEIWK